MSGLEIRRLILLSGVMLAVSHLPACQALDAAFDTPTLKAGERTCTSGYKAQCDEMYEIAAALNTPDMDRRVAEALR